MYANVIETMVILFVLAMVGFVANKLGYTNHDFDRTLSKIVFDITCPALILSSVMSGDLPDRKMILPLLVVGFLTYLILVPVSWLYGKAVGRTRDEQGVLAFISTFGNVGFIGYPVVTALFGAGSVFYAAMLNFPNSVFVYTLGIIMIAGRRQAHLNWKVLISPGLVCSYLAAAIVALGIDDIPRIIAQPVTLVGSITVPASMIIVGSQMAEIPLRKMLGSWRAYTCVAMRLLVAPVLIWAVMYAAGGGADVNNVNTAVIAMPAASLATILCLRYDKDMTLVEVVTFLTYIFSILTIPLVSLLFHSA